MKIPDVSVLFSESMDSGPISAVQDHFGPCYRCLQGVHHPGGIFAFRLIAGPRARSDATGESGESIVHVRIIRAVHGNTVRALVRRSKHPGRALKRGHWYEVISD